MITEMTPEQWARVDEYVDRGLRYGRSTEPADREAAENAVRDAYRERGLEPPGIVVWARSPFEGCAFSTMAAAMGRDQLKAQLRDPLRAPLRDQLWDQLRAQLGDQLRDQLWDQLRAQLGDQLWDQLRAQLWDPLSAQLWDQLWDQLRDQLGDQLWAQLGDQLGDQLWKACYGPHDLFWLLFYEFIRRELGQDLGANPGPAIRIAENSGWWWPMRGAVILSERPTELHIDQDGRMHSETGHAIRYPDGWGFHAWHGTRVPAEWIEQRDSLDPSIAITWRNMEQRRCAAEIIGWDRVIERLNARAIDTDPDPTIGTLVEVDLPDYGQERFLRVLCGTGRQFALPVPPTMSTALEAQCWRHGDIDPSIIRAIEVRT